MTIAVEQKLKDPIAVKAFKVRAVRCDQGIFSSASAADALLWGWLAGCCCCCCVCCCVWWLWWC